MTSKVYRRSCGSRFPPLPSEMWTTMLALWGNGAPWGRLPSMFPTLSSRWRGLLYPNSSTASEGARCSLNAFLQNLASRPLVESYVISDPWTCMRSSCSAALCVLQAADPLLLDACVAEGVECATPDLIEAKYGSEILSLLASHPRGRLRIAAAATAHARPGKAREKMQAIVRNAEQERSDRPSQESRFPFPLRAASGRCFPSMLPQETSIIDGAIGLVG
jgi:hypothetical protein